MRVFGLVFLLLAGLSVGARAQEGTLKTLVLAADRWCPINCEAGGAEEGVALDIARRVFGPLGYKVVYRIMPWSRALEEVRAGNIDGVVGANRQDDPTLIFPTEPVHDMTDGIYTLSDSALEFQDINSLKGHFTGVIRDYGYGTEVKRFIEDNRHIPGMIQEVGGEKALEQNIRKLQAGRVEAVIEATPVMQYELSRRGLGDKIKRIGGVYQGPVYIAFSPTRTESAALAKAYDEGVARLREENSLSQLYERYGLTP